MTLSPTSRFKALAPTLFFATCLCFAGCATTTDPIDGPISTTPSTEVDPADSEGTDTTDPVDEEIIEDPTDEETGTAYTPPHMQDRDLIRAGVLLPFSHPNANVRKQAESMLAGIELALFQTGNQNFLLLPKDTGSKVSTAEVVATELKEQGADIILGPLFGQNVTMAKTIFEDEQILTFSNDSSVAGGNVWQTVISPEAEVAEMVRYASLRGYNSFAFFGPQSGLGEKIARSLQFEASRNGAFVISTAYYPTSSVSPATEAEYFAKSIASAVEGGARVAIMVPERGTRLRRIAPLLAYYGVDTRQVKLLGIGGWNDPAVWREPSLRGAWFPAPSQAALEEFQVSYQRLYGNAPSSLAPVAFDAAALAITVMEDGETDLSELLDPEGFAGVNGLFRFRLDGMAERSLSVLEIDPTSETGVTVVKDAATTFTPSIN